MMKTKCLRLLPVICLAFQVHAQQLPERDYLNVNIDLNIHGVGGVDSWGARMLDEYTIDGNQVYYYGYVMEYSD